MRRPFADGADARISGDRHPYASPRRAALGAAMASAGSRAVSWSTRGGRVRTGLAVTKFRAILVENVDDTELPESSR